ncbi:hypothetical protein BV509_20660 [Rhodovulum sulfidophilum]|uniref:Heavy-metal-associated domain-containing protein n=1 Tax=Rhodovulum visakhapatnamense TaxID=364297 RepID=A0ABS1RDW4_9RHOB|nr:hypothetical protein [Rhodovulum visakhapatnamense]MBL3569750.1 hypothetical protein [Rhodovulum visakhapatnamense]MBL3577832.1 hypothetical protein [Rhodovulum visakhapatnamense]OLS42337.1 hypothetical protein BV509_20660 [Rhodovulum sulfidophilum]
MVSCVHHIPGRARFKIEALRRDPELARMIEANVGSLEGVSSVEINRYAASIIVHYCPRTSEIERIMGHICDHCPKSADNRQRGPVPQERGATDRLTSVRPPAKVGVALRDAAAKAVVNTLIKRAVEQSLAGLVVGLR